MSKRISRTLETTKFKGVSIVPVAAKPGGEVSSYVITPCSVTIPVFYRVEKFKFNAICTLGIR